MVRCSAQTRVHGAVGLGNVAKDLDKRMAQLLELPNEETAAARVRRLVEATGVPAGVPVYLLERGTEQSSLNRVATDRSPIVGAPDGSTVVLTLDLDTVPTLRSRYRGRRVLTLSIPGPPHAFERAEIATHAAGELELGGGEPFGAQEVMVPRAVFDWELTSAAMTRVRDAVAGADRVLGRPAFLQSNPHAGDEAGFVMQLSAGFVDLDLGDGGRAFVYDDHCFWESL